MGKKLAYLEGYIKGLHLDPSSAYSRALKEITRCLSSMDEDIDDLKDKTDELYDKVEDIDDIIDDMSSCECGGHCNCSCQHDSSCVCGNSESLSEHTCCDKECNEGSGSNNKPVDKFKQQCSGGSCGFPEGEPEDSDYDYDCEECCLDSDNPDVRQ